MPYITKERKIFLDPAAGGLPPDIPENAGELNYQLTRLILRYIEGHSNRYQTYNDIVGALECCKQEFIRRVVNDYEDEKIKINGDVYT